MKNFVLFILSILFFFYPCILTNAGDLNGYDEENIIFLLDSSQSMSEVDKDYKALERKEKSA